MKEVANLWWVGAGWGREGGGSVASHLMYTTRQAAVIILDNKDEDGSI